MNRWWALGFCLVAAGGLALRCVRLDNRPMHNDEAVNAIKLGGYWQPGHYRYDPNEHHGPTLYYSSLPLVWLTGTRNFNDLSETTLRLTPALFGVGLIVLLWPLAAALGRGATLVAALLTAISPAMVFYSRYYIHEMLLVFFTMVVLVGGWRYSQSRKLGWAVFTGASLGLMFATKETFVFSVVAMIAAVGLTVWIGGGKPGVQQLLVSCSPRHALAGAVAALIVALTLFSSFGTNLDGPLDSLRTYLPWLKRAGGSSPHIHPWHFYLERLVCFHRPKGPWWSEGAIVLLGLTGGFHGFCGKPIRGIDRGIVRYLTCYSLSLAGIYSGVAYKTPWCMIGFLHGFILLAGVGAIVLGASLKAAWLKVLMSVFGLSAGVHLAWQTWEASFVRFAEWRNPYVYAQTVPDVLRLVVQVQELARFHPDRNQMDVRVAAPENDYWPLPFYFRNLKKVGWYESLPDDLRVPVIISSSKLAGNLDEKSAKQWLLVGLFELRPRVFFELYVETNLWRKCIAERQSPKPEP